MRGDEPPDADTIAAVVLHPPHVRGDEPGVDTMQFGDWAIRPTCVGMNRQVPTTPRNAAPSAPRAWG